jgi:hypothetical protein
MGGWSYRRWTLAHLGGHLFLVLLNLWIAVPRPHAFDPMCYYAWAQSVVADGDIDLGNQLAGNPNYPVIQFNGRPIVNDKCGIGWSLVALPFMAAGQAVRVLLQWIRGRRRGVYVERLTTRSRSCSARGTDCFSGIR